jgi:hypothetical protein
VANEPSTLESLIQEASDPETDPERLQELANSRKDSVRRAAWQNSNLPEEVWRNALLEGHPEAWDNPMAPFYLLAWTPREKDPQTLEFAARSATSTLWREPERCSTDGKVLIATKVMEWWATSKSTQDMIGFLVELVQVHGIGSREHKQLIRILVKCVRTTPNLTPEDLDLLNSIEQWSKGLHQNPPNVFLVNYQVPVTHTYLSINYPISNPRIAIYNVVRSSVKKMVQSYPEAKAEHNRFLAELIRQEMPVPPTAE